MSSYRLCTYLVGSLPSPTRIGRTSVRCPKPPVTFFSPTVLISVIGTTFPCVSVVFWYIGLEFHAPSLTFLCWYCRLQMTPDWYTLD